MRITLRFGIIGKHVASDAHVYGSGQTHRKTTDGESSHITFLDDLECDCMVLRPLVRSSICAQLAGLCGVHAVSRIDLCAP